MKHRDERRSDEELRRELRRELQRGDPAQDGRDPGPEEIAEMRRAILAARRSPAARWEWAPLAALASLVLVAGAGWLVVRRGVVDDARDAVTLTHPPAAGTPTVPGDPAIAAPPAAPVDDPVAVTEIPAPPAVAPPGAEAVPAGQAVLASGDRPSRTIRFTTPNGTRIVWLLDPNLDI